MRCLLSLQKPIPALMWFGTEAGEVLAGEDEDISDKASG